MKELDLDPANPSTQTILNMGDKYVGDDLSAENVANAVRKGHADFIALVDARAKEYVASKAKVAETVPGSPAGAGAAGEPPAAEPRDVAEAIKMARKALRGQ
jgi:hypothetical protein